MLITKSLLKRDSDAEPGDKEVLMYGATFNPFFIAFFAKRPAPNITDGFEVLVHDVIAAITKFKKTF